MGPFVNVLDNGLNYFLVTELCLGIFGTPYRANEFLERCLLLTTEAVYAKRN